MMGKAKDPALPMARGLSHWRFWNILSWFDPSARPAVHPIDEEATFDGAADQFGSTIPTLDQSKFVSEPIASKLASRSEHSPIRYLALGTPSDRKAFTTAIRAFALAGKLGDSLTLIGYGRHRRRLEKWSTALRMGAIVTFSQHDCHRAPDPSAFDCVILLPSCDERQIGVVADILAKGLRVISMSQEPEVINFIRDRKLGLSIGSADAMILNHAMLSERYSACVL